MDERPTLRDDELALRRRAVQELRWLEEVDLAARHLDRVLTDFPGLPRPTQLLEEIRRRAESLAATAGHPLVKRRRPKQKWKDRWDANRPAATVAIDESGLPKGHDPNAPFFATAAVVIRDTDLPEVERQIRGRPARWSDPSVHYATGT